MKKKTEQHGLNNQDHFSVEDSSPALCKSQSYSKLTHRANENSILNIVNQN